MTTSHADHAQAMRILQETGCTFEQAHAIMARFNAAGIHLLKVEPPVEPYTGDKAPEQTAEYVQARRALKGIATTDTQKEATS